MRLQSGDRLTFITDGVVEARNAAMDLFGVERAREMSREPAATIAVGAQSFGQGMRLRWWVCRLLRLEVRAARQSRLRRRGAIYCKDAKGAKEAMEIVLVGDD